MGFAINFSNLNNSEKFVPTKRLPIFKMAEKKKTGFTKPMKLSTELADICGTSVASRAECVKFLWAYLKKHNLQEPENKQFFVPDKKMAKIFGTEKLRGFSMTKHIGAHLTPIDE